MREALVELASLGLVDLLPNRGAVVQPFGPQEIREISQIRRLLEVEATSCACGRIPDDELAALEREFTQLEVLPHDQAWDQRASRRFQAARPGRQLLRQSPAGGRNRPLPGPFPALRDVSHQRDAWTNYSRSNDVPEHLAIVAALLEPDANAAGLAMDRHIRSAAIKLEEVVFSGADTLETGGETVGSP